MNESEPPKDLGGILGVRGVDGARTLQGKREKIEPAEYMLSLPEDFGVDLPRLTDAQETGWQDKAILTAGMASYLASLRLQGVCRLCLICTLSACSIKPLK